MNNESVETKQLVDAIVEGIKEKKGEKIVTINLSEIENAVCKYFVICNANTNTQVKAIVDSVDEFTRKEVNEKAWRKEGFENAQWILLDYGSVVVHVFQTEYRGFYNIEGLWADAEINEIADNI